MAVECIAEVGRPTARRDELSRRLRRVALIVPAIALVGGAIAMPLDLRSGLFAAALIMGWTQLVGL
ncbi:MAG TPA: hypothetical protein VFL91_17145 [Thermomicrobiales bacterium]|nr:hypothetical protein [Thermomicrobiales bacterium]